MENSTLRRAGNGARRTERKVFHRSRAMVRCIVKCDAPLLCSVVRGPHTRPAAPHLPMQNRVKIVPSRSSLVNSR